MTESNVIADIRRLLEGLPAGDRRRLLAAMRSIHDVLGGRSRRDGAVLRPPRPGDLGWIVERNGALYAEECGWDRTYEALVAAVVADYVRGLAQEAEPGPRGVTPPRARLRSDPATGTGVGRSTGRTRSPAASRFLWGAAPTSLLSLRPAGEPVRRPCRDAVAASR